MELLGQRFGHIRVTGVVGEGGMGAVYSGFDETLERRVALKVIHEDLRLDEEARERLLREARALSRLDHPNICRIHDYVEASDSDLLVLEYIDGRTLTAALREKHSRAEKLRIAISVAEVLVVAHRAGILHRDLKPDNVMLTTSGEVKVLDFGLARLLNRARNTRTGDDEEEAAPRPRVVHDDDAPRTPSGFLKTQAGVSMGTPMYMSPEQARGEELTPASDMFAFGLLLQLLFTGTEPHPDFLGARQVMQRVAKGETNAVQGLPRDIAALINRLKQFAPADRPTAVETLERLQWLAGKPARITRQSIAAAVLLMALLGAWRYMVDLRRERTAALAAEARAVAARAEAEHRRDQAEGLIEFMIGDLRTKLEPVGRLDILDDVAKRTLAYVNELDPATLNA
ncbi:MAG TPA: serine/threonine-protein kinase, partial [Thermoanaerobaculia bacterium]